MGSTTHGKAVAHESLHTGNFARLENMERELSPEFLKVVQEAAIAAAKTMGNGDHRFSDEVAVDP